MKAPSSLRSSQLPNLSVAVDALTEDPLDEVDVVAGAVVDEGDPVDARAHPLAHPAPHRARAPLAPVERLALRVSRAVHLQRLKRLKVAELRRGVCS